MTSAILSPFDLTMIELRTKEIYRFLGYRSITPTPEIDERISICTEKMQGAASPRCFYRKFSVTQEAPDITNIAGLRIRSRNLYRNLSGCDYAYMFAATVGMGIDHLIKRSELTSMLDAAIYQAAGAEMIESYADAEVEKLKEAEARNGYVLRPRYSPGYGDLPLALQADFARILDMQKWCGIILTDTLLMVPSKSITAFIGCVKRPSETSEPSGNSHQEKPQPNQAGVRSNCTDQSCAETIESPTGASSVNESDDSAYLADVINPLEATGRSAAEATENQHICSDRQVSDRCSDSDKHTISNRNSTTSCTLCSKAPDCLYRIDNT